MFFFLEFDFTKRFRTNGNKNQNERYAILDPKYIVLTPLHCFHNSDDDRQLAKSIWSSVLVAEYTERSF